MIDRAPAAEGIQAWLEKEWLDHFKRHGKGKGWRAESLVGRAQAKRLCETRLLGWHALAELARHGVLAANPKSLECGVPQRIRLSDEAAARLGARLAEPDAALLLSGEQHAAWRRALDTGQGLGDWSPADQQRLVSGLCSLAAALPEAYRRLSAFEASARYLLGSSKLLKALPRELVLAFGIDPEAFRRPKVRLLASMPPAPQGVLLIENPQSFDQACRLGLDRQLALVCSFGYGLSLGEALDDPSVSLIGEGPLPLGLEALLALPRLIYWGDLDPEGLRIFQRLRRRLPRLRLSALYAPMTEALECQGHPLHRLTGKGGQRATGAWDRGLDQEWLLDEHLEALAGEVLSLEGERSLLERCAG